MAISYKEKIDTTQDLCLWLTTSGNKEKWSYGYAVLVDKPYLDTFIRIWEDESIHSPDVLKTCSNGIMHCMVIHNDGYLTPESAINTGRGVLKVRQRIYQNAKKEKL